MLRAFTIFLALLSFNHSESSPPPIIHPKDMKALSLMLQRFTDREFLAFVQQEYQKNKGQLRQEFREDGVADEYMDAAFKIYYHTFSDETFDGYLEFYNTLRGKPVSIKGIRTSSSSSDAQSIQKQSILLQKSPARVPDFDEEARLILTGSASRTKQIRRKDKKKGRKNKNGK